LQEYPPPNSEILNKCPESKVLPKKNLKLVDSFNDLPEFFY